MNAIVKISKRAKQIQRSTGKPWKACIKSASVEYRAGKLGRATTTTKKKKEG